MFFRYAISKAIRNKQRIIYTTLIEKLCVLKYCEFNEKIGGSIGLMTKNNTINSSANCIIMTTTVLRNLLDSNLSKDLVEVQWIIIDDINFMGDEKLGVVLEETIILFPSTWRFVILSSTIASTDEFGDLVTWVRTDCHAITSEKREVDVLRFILTPSGNNLISVQNFVSI